MVILHSAEELKAFYFQLHFHDTQYAGLTTSLEIQ